MCVCARSFLNHCIIPGNKIIQCIGRTVQIKKERKTLQSSKNAISVYNNRGAGISEED